MDEANLKVLIAKGGVLLLGVEDSGKIAGVHPDHSDAEGIVPLI